MHVDASETGPDGCGDGCLDGDLVPADGVDDGIGQKLSRLLQEIGPGVHLVPFDVDPGGVDAASRGQRNLRTDAVAAD